MNFEQKNTNEKITNLMIEAVNVLITKFNEQRKDLNMIPLPAYLNSFHGYCCEPAEDILNAVKPNPMNSEEIERRVKENWENITRICNEKKDEYSKKLDEEIERLKKELESIEQSQAIQSQLDTLCQMVKDHYEQSYDSDTANITINVEHVNTLIGNIDGAQYTKNYWEDESDEQGD